MKHFFILLTVAVNTGTILFALWRKHLKPDSSYTHLHIKLENATQ